MSRLHLGLAALLFLLMGCGTDPVRVETEKHEVDPEVALDLYAFRQREVSLEDVELEGTRGEFEEALREELNRLGLVEARYGDSPLVIDFELEVAENQRSLDPNFAFHSVEKFEEGLVHLMFLGGIDNQVIWEGRIRLRLRALARGAGITSVNWTPVNEQRSWRIEELLDALIAESGLEEAATDPGRAERSLSPEARRDFFKRLYEVLPEKKIEITHEKER